VHKCALKFIFFFFSTFGASLHPFSPEQRVSYWWDHLKHRTPSFTLYQAPLSILIFRPRQDFRELVKDLYKIYRARIWLRTFLNRYPPGLFDSFFILPNNTSPCWVGCNLHGPTTFGGGVGHVVGILMGGSSGGRGRSGRLLCSEEPSPNPETPVNDHPETEGSALCRSHTQ